MKGVVREVVETLGISHAEARRRLTRAVAACGGSSADLAPLLGVTKRRAREIARENHCRLHRTWETVGAPKRHWRRA